MNDQYTIEDYETALRVLRMAGTAYQPQSVSELMDLLELLASQRRIEVQAETIQRQQENEAGRINNDD
jgi:hypothetical protein